MMRAAQKAKQELPATVLTQTRSYLAPLRSDFTEEITAPKVASASNLVNEWNNKKQATENLMKLLQAYKDIGDAKSEPLLKNHNPRTFEDRDYPVPDFRTQNLKAGDVPKFFDTVISTRASAAIASKDKFWAGRKTEAEAASAKASAAFPRVAVPEWKKGKTVSIENLNTVTDKYAAALVPKRKLALPVLPEGVKKAVEDFAASVGQAKNASEVSELLAKSLAEKAVVTEGGKVVEGFSYVSKAVAAKVIATRRAEVHERLLKLWAKRLLVSPELAIVPLNEFDAQLASKFEGISPKYQELLSAVAQGNKTFAQRLNSSPAFSSFLLKREKAESEVPPSELELEAAQKAAELEDPEVALRTLLGPQMEALGASDLLLSEQIRVITEHRYTPDRLQYKEGMKLADKIAAQEAALKEELKVIYGDNVDVKHFQASPRTPVQQLFDSLKNAAANKERAAKEAAAAASPYLAYAVTKKQEVQADPSNIPFDEVLYPQLSEELLELELSDIREDEIALEKAEEEELWLLTLTQQFKHIQKHFGIDLPHSVVAHMDPLLIKKIDWETTNALEDFDITLDDMGAEDAKEQWGAENLSHHFLPLIRYRRDLARKNGDRYGPDLVNGN
uniref:ATP synthase associated protein ASA1 n=1 Tax=Polytomella sp. Pringsheim 198.80 TaxID=37502 RepID=Q85JD5_9CHLO|nr:Chain 1, ATP synthase associated protein ASA1 [Polytomella sp. Pringsheim 198.80]6RD5_1 Chain 1, ATP synthase associated protein ASA1 [Polytomella sp. Pringsheim 198.80]6RD7_1 Chain 1, ATP synthase associated protein ASA1 [Polytomella sp. Pringsheim 198.80]6RD8_1 Chain 1, ATP synthase associated protein ASA1 [Polytomella sp. Pringsheim 198.80]6RD9_1 Chain 1, ATP synthase associated protein ASA1 [Polytomella sp. Pringsheim 198.80]6RDA_1 Chain 1, ATP synthase associated protein ASA1 [Polytome|mmetsp:Transcript_34966/g.62856  ORF Transcript_34966/g.62856 Transcript_34966/m.62856 type:complete len:619 (-) Transcript_34966:272-2128(-)|eukprot:CAMPEP_0175050206 /NCGR_PEP_ID=MMETSP0052_2-20121109/7139_1 /TAXON_ID=51329 ORGANISM="Polytomella parva, Strain SAG 63-3" /NCGR_SAMPLE_ID=MMETSP0052_2 /ASSEMBLY_ACC=CAM_ASM_000194 /LENGTH=618 /DNA_ID=CAMNT_0016314401 /DNA_START=101 /DNA_END=1957 /DNA_ORIENTATION=+